MAVGEGDVWFYVVDRRTVHEVCACDNKFPGFYSQQAHGRQGEGVGSEGRTRSKDPYPLIASQARGAYRERKGMLMSRRVGVVALSAVCFNGSTVILPSG